jgi:hypothetical protein
LIPAAARATIERPRRRSTSLWPRRGFCLLAGDGTRPGVVHGVSGKDAAYPASDPVGPSDMVATIDHLLGFDPDLTVPDRLGRPVPIAPVGAPIRGVIL